MSVSKSVRNLGGTARERPIFRRLVGGIFYWGKLQMVKMKKVVPSAEQQVFIDRALDGENILVDACIGSGKTTAIQYLCDEIAVNKKILYLTYNKLLKLDAKSKIKNTNATVNNYHGFAWGALNKVGVRAGISDLIQTFLEKKPILDYYDVLIIDEYQDIEQELSELLEYVKVSNPNLQIIAVGDMEQKIYDKTTLNVPKFINQFLGEYVQLGFTNCFRLSSELAARLGRIWKKKIVGTNPNCLVEEMTLEKTVEFLSEQKPSDILCLGARKGDMANTLNKLEENYPIQFNKKTVYASISDRNSDGSSVQPKKSSAIFTTFDSSKGLERKICVVFDYTEGYWSTRLDRPQQSYEILRNIFCVAASRGKEHIIFVKSEEHGALLSEETLSTNDAQNDTFTNIDISEMFDFKYKEDIEKCFSLLETKLVTKANEVSEIKIANHDEMIDLSPCIGIYQEAVYFENYNIDDSIELRYELLEKKDDFEDAIQSLVLDEKILLLTSLETRQERYTRQVLTPFVTESDKQLIFERLGTQFSQNEEEQLPCSLGFSDKKNGELLFSALGFTDVIKNKTVYELKFVSELSHEHFLQCASYMLALDLEKGILWNTRFNIIYEIKIPDKEKLLDQITRTITKGKIDKYYKPIRESVWREIQLMKQEVSSNDTN